MRSSKGRVLSQEWREKISLGIKRSYAEGRRLRNPSEITKKKISSTLKKMPISEGLKKGWVLGKERVGDKHPMWKGNNVHYTTFHKWLRRHYGKAKKCENKECERKSCVFHWALLHEKEYQKTVENFVQLCASCHMRYDKSKDYKILI